MLKLYTGNGDGGRTDTINRRAVSKADPIIELIGTLDEASAAIGTARALCKGSVYASEAEWMLKKLSALMGEFAGGKTAAEETLLHELEEKIDAYAVSFEGFTLPGESMPSAIFNTARTIVRRAERVGAKLFQEGEIRPAALACLNRFSDLLYAISRCTEDLTKGNCHEY